MASRGGSDRPTNFSTKYNAVTMQSLQEHLAALNRMGFAAPENLIHRIETFDFTCAAGADILADFVRVYLSDRTLGNANGHDETEAEIVAPAGMRFLTPFTSCAIVAGPLTSGGPNF